MKRNTLLFFCLILPLFFSTPLDAQKRKKDKKETTETTEDKHYLDEVSLSGLKFRAVGPALTSGRISDFAVHPDNHAVYYVAVSSGGVWKTTNGGTSYSPTFDSQGSYSIGCVTIDPNNPNVVWVGTGENNNQRSVAYGDGIYKSTDGGASWEHKGLKESEHIGKIIVDPNNSDVIYVAAIGPLWSEGGDRGLYKSTDGGDNWEPVLTVDEHTGVTDVVMDPRDPNVLYAVTYQRRRHVFTYVGGGPGSAVYKSTDGGANWDKITRGLPSVDLGRMGLAISPADPETIYLMVEAAQGKSGFFKSTNRGASWSKQSSYYTRGNYYTEIIAHPNRPGVVFAMDTWMHWTTNGGKSFERVGEQWKHVDNHCIWIDPTDDDHYLVGCDGGIYETYDGGSTWDYKENLPVTQFYKVAVDNDQPFYNIYGGTQDNFSLGGPSRTRSGNGIVNADWYVTHGGDGFESAVDPNDPNIVYAQSQYGVLFRYDRASGESMGIQPKPREGEDAYRWNWDAPLQVSEHLPTRIYFAANKLFRSDDRGNSWEVISPDLTRQIDRNTLEVMGRVQSIDAVAKNASTSPYGTIVAFSESPLNENLLYVGTDDGLIQVTADGGENWTKIESVPGVPERTYVNMLLASQHDENVVYAVFNNHKNGDFKPYVFKSNDRGSSWQNITNNLPERGSTYSIAEDHVNKGLLFVGTEFGCFTSVDGGAYWKGLKAGLPTIAVRDIAIQERENDLVLGTFGRGFYVLDDYSPLRFVKEETMDQEAIVFPIKDGLIYIESLPLGLRGNSFQGHNYYSADNPPVGVTFTYHVKEGWTSLRDKRRKEEQKMIKEGEEIRYPTYEELEAEQKEKKAYLLFVIQDKDGHIVRQLKTSVRKGVQRIVWDGRQPSLEPVDLRPSGFDNPFSNPDVGILAMPGEYTVSVSQSVNGTLTDLVDPVPFKLNTLGGVTLETNDRMALVQFQEKVAELSRAFSGATEAMQEANNRLRHIKQAIYAVDKSPDEWDTQVNKIEETLAEIRKEFYGDPLAGRLDKGSEMGIAARLGWMAYEMWSSTSAPTATQKEAYRIAGKVFDAQLSKLERLISVDLEALEQRLEEAGAPYTPGRIPKWGKE